MTVITGPKVLLVPPDVYDKAKAEGARVYEPDAPLTNDTRVPLMRDNLGVCKPGEGFEISQKIFEPLRFAPFVGPVEPHPRLDSLLSLGLSLSMMLPQSPKFLGLDLGKEEPMVFTDHFEWFERGIYWRTMNQINGRKRHEQQRLDRWSNVRRAKRARELARRRNRP